jgi:hypothetical protein
MDEPAAHLPGSHNLRVSGKWYYSLEDPATLDTIAHRAAVEALRPYSREALRCAVEILNEPNGRVFKPTDEGDLISRDEMEAGVKTLGDIVFAKLRDAALK